jgi:prepilin peptidase CpaA
MSSVHVLFLALFPALTIVAALYDVTSYRIPNWISLAIVALFVPAVFTAGLPLMQIGLCLAVGFAVLVVGIGLFALRALGGGDAKLLAASALWFGWPQIQIFLLYTVLAGGVLSLVLIVMRSGFVQPYLLRGPGWLVRLSAPGRQMPYGVAIAVGALAALPISPLA